jgi:hypothetical protein
MMKPASSFVTRLGKRTQMETVGCAENIEFRETESLEEGDPVQLGEPVSFLPVLSWSFSIWAAWEARFFLPTCPSLRTGPSSPLLSTSCSSSGSPTASFLQEDPASCASHCVWCVSSLACSLVGYFCSFPPHRASWGVSALPSPPQARLCILLPAHSQTRPLGILLFLKHSSCVFSWSAQLFLSSTTEFVTCDNK